jgi:hypothetical protein
LKNTKLHQTSLALLKPLEKAPRFSTIEQFSINNPAFSESALRNLVHKANERDSSKGKIAGNGFLEIGAIIRIGRKVLINEERFFNWIESHSHFNKKV